MPKSEHFDDYCSHSRCHLALNFVALQRIFEKVFSQLIFQLMSELVRLPLMRSFVSTPLEDSLVTDVTALAGLYDDQARHVMVAHDMSREYDHNTTVVIDFLSNSEVVQKIS